MIARESGLCINLSGRVSYAMEMDVDNLPSLIEFFILWVSIIDAFEPLSEIEFERN